MKMMRSRILKSTWILLFFIQAPLFAVEFSVLVEEPGSKKRIPDAQVIILETKTKLFTGQDGTVQANVPKTGIYTLRVILPDGTLIERRIDIRYERELITIQTASTQTVQGGGEGITITGMREKTKLSRYQVRIDEVRRLPGSFGEALRGLELLPGISAPPFGSGEIFIRGADQNANIYLLDELPIGYAFHFFPVNSVVHNDLIKSMDAYSGAYPANYGNATGGVISIETIDDVDRPGGNVSFSLWSTNLLFKNTIGDGAGYWIAAGRVSYMHKTLQQYVPEGVRMPIYWDGQFKMRLNLTRTQRLYLYSFGAKDLFAAKISDRPTWDPVSEFDPVLIGARIDTDSSFHTEAIRHVWTPGSRLQNKLTLFFTENIFHLDAELGEHRANQILRNGYGGLREELGWEAVLDHLYLDAGFEARSYGYRYYGETIQQIDPNDPNPNFYDTQNPSFENVPIDDSLVSGYHSAWAMMTLRGFGFELKPGYRVDSFAMTDHTVGSPRATLSYTLPTKTVLIAGAGVYHRIPDIQKFSPSSGNPDLKFERSEHYGAGIEQTIGKWLFKIEGFRHTFSDITVEDPYIETPYRVNEDLIRRRTDPLQYLKTEILRPANRNDDLILYNQRKYFSNDGTAHSIGYEIYIKKENPPEAKGWYGWLSYTWSKTMQSNHQHILTDQEKNSIYSANERRILMQYDNTNELYADYDRTHILNLVLGYRMNREWQFGGRWKYMTATPYTPITGDDGGEQKNKGRTIFDPEYSDLTNSERLRPFHRLDLRIDRFLNYTWGYGNLYFEALNIYLRKNPIGMGWSNSSPYSRTNPSQQYDFSLLQQQSGKEKILYPLFNIGLEVKF
jgi:hypothetical protein